MKSPQRRRALTVLASGSAVLAGGLLARVALAQAPREIEITAQRFRFTPNEIPLKVGERVVIALSSLDFEHGFSVPELRLRADFVPGRVVRVELQPKVAGKLDFLCDNFCGDDHEDMYGRFLVSA